MNAAARTPAGDAGPAGVYPRIRRAKAVERCHGTLQDRSWWRRGGWAGIRDAPSRRTAFERSSCRSTTPVSRSVPRSVETHIVDLRGRGRWSGRCRSGGDARGQQRLDGSRRRNRWFQLTASNQRLSLAKQRIVVCEQLDGRISIASWGSRVGVGWSCRSVLVGGSNEDRRKAERAASGGRKPRKPANDHPRGGEGCEQRAAGCLRSLAPARYARPALREAHPPLS